MSWGASPSGKHDKGVVDSDPKQEERGGEVQRDELHPQIAGESESGKDGKDGSEEAEETDQWLRAHRVRHRRCNEAEEDHDGDVDQQVRSDRVLRTLHLPGWGRRYKSVDDDAGHLFLSLTYHCQKVSFPLVTN